MLYYILFQSNLTANEAVIHFLITIFVYVFSLTLHEFAHAFVAYKCGDQTPKMSGRMTMNPLKHMDLFGFMLFIFLGIGWAKPVPVNPTNFKKYKKGTRLVSMAGVTANFLIGLVSAITFAILMATVGLNGGVAMQYVYVVLTYAMLINSFLFMFNILPIPPLDGFNFLATLLTPDNKFLIKLARNSIKILFGFILMGIVTDLVFGFDIFSVYLELLFNYVYTPIMFLGVL